LIRKAIAGDPDAAEEVLNRAEGPVGAPEGSADAGTIQAALAGDKDAWNRLPPLHREWFAALARLELVRRKLMGELS
jgi:hypothetical protein